MKPCITGLEDWGTAGWVIFGLRSSRLWPVHRVCWGGRRGQRGFRCHYLVLEIWRKENKYTPPTRHAIDKIVFRSLNWFEIWMRRFHEKHIVSFWSIYSIRLKLCAALYWWGAFVSALKKIAAEDSTWERMKRRYSLWSKLLWVRIESRLSKAFNTSLNTSIKHT